MCFASNTRGLTFTTSWSASNNVAILRLEKIKAKEKGLGILSAMIAMTSVVGRQISIN